MDLMDIPKKINYFKNQFDIILIFTCLSLQFVVHALNSQSKSTAYLNPQ